jgi:crotonobetainyl-CoA:carnitine CoA-transferase CaiB-like acyl-CoA transferase
VNEVLAGLRVLDLTNALAASSATKILSDLGAEVVKIENPDGGDYTRRLMPYIFEAHNRSKRSFAVDLKRPEGVALIKEFATTCDVLVQSMRPGAAREAGLGAEQLAVVNPQLIYASFSAFGPTGPSAHRRGVDGVAQAESGLAALQNGVLGGTSFVDTTAGLALSHAILIALMKRDRYGVVEPIDVCLLDTALYMQAAPLIEFSVEGVLVDQRGYPSRYSTVGVYEAADGPFFVAPYWERDWRALCAIVEREDLLTHARFAERAARGENTAELRELLGKEFGRRPRLDWLAELEGQGILAGIVRSYAEVLDDPQVRANQALEQHVLSDGRTAMFPRAPFRFAGQPLVNARTAPELGADTAGLLAEIGVDGARLENLYAAGVVTGPRAA